jgi:hypothetical protein
MMERTDSIDLSDLNNDEEWKKQLDNPHKANTVDQILKLYLARHSRKDKLPPFEDKENGYYMFEDKKIYILNNEGKLEVRIGEFQLDIEEFIDTYAP